MIVLSPVLAVPCVIQLYQLKKKTLYLSYQMSLALWVDWIDVTSFSVVSCPHTVSHLMCEGVVSNGPVLQTEADLSVTPWVVGHPRVF